MFCACLFKFFFGANHKALILHVTLWLICSYWRRMNTEAYTSCLEQNYIPYSVQAWKLINVSRVFKKFESDMKD